MFIPKVTSGWTLTKKIVLSVGLASFLTFPPFAYFTVKIIKESITSSYIDKTAAVSQLLDSGVRDFADFSDQDRLWDVLQKALWLNPDLLWIDVNKQSDGKLRTVVSSKPDHIGGTGSPANQLSLTDDTTIHEIIDTETGRQLKLVSPVHVGKQIVGTFELSVTLETVDRQVEKTVLFTVSGYLALLAIFFVFLFINLRLTVVRPVRELNEQTERFAAGDFDARADITGKNELGKLAASLNSMADAIKNRDMELEERNSTLEDMNLEMKENASILKEALSEAERSNRVKSEFLATMSHEFRTPLNAILGFSDLMRGEHFGPLGAKNYKDYMQDIHDSGAHMLALVNDVLDISQIEAGMRPLVKESIDIRDLLAECVKKLEVLANNKGIALSTEIADDVPDLYADNRSVVQIVQNLLSNAIKFSNRNGTVRITAQTSAYAVRIMVIDRGIGIPGDDIDGITEPFSRSDTDAHLAQEGTGLGLSIVKALVKAHEGHLKIESDVGQGTTVTVVLPHGTNL